MSFYPFALHEISVLIELILGHLRYRLTDVPPQPNSPPDSFFNLDRRTGRASGHLTGRYHGRARRIAAARRRQNMALWPETRGEPRAVTISRLNARNPHGVETAGTLPN